MKNSKIKDIIITCVGFEVVSQKYLAHHDAGHFVISFEEYQEMKAAIIKSGQYVIPAPKEDNRTLAEILETAL